MFGNYTQCMVVQELVHARLMAALHAQSSSSQAKAQSVQSSESFNVVLFVRDEAAGIVIGKQGFVLNQIRKQSGAKIYIMREHVKGQRPCILSGDLSHILRAEKHIFD